MTQNLNGSAAPDRSATLTEPADYGRGAAPVPVRLQWNGSAAATGTIGAGPYVVPEVEHENVRPDPVAATRLEHTGRGTPWQIAYSGAVGSER
ncbi:hypothetical protein NBRGN_068_01580 [Nocardia brasiliensis NBRC 14402]|nr:hypothetical protein NBRGN_068_01580 [Nocardia brasiliensis NBRC 14402]